jgi:hypothetical protein
MSTILAGLSLGYSLKVFFTGGRGQGVVSLEVRKILGRLWREKKSVVKV